jgi:hypothetical protein
MDSILRIRSLFRLPYESSRWNGMDETMKMEAVMQQFGW